MAAPRGRVTLEPIHLADDRGVAGLPVRLVVAFVVGTAVLGVMLNMVSGVGALTTTELDAHPTPDVVHPGNGTITVAAVDPDGHALPDVTVVLSADTAGLAGGRPVVARTNASGVATLHATPTLPPTADQGTLTLTVKPPSGKYADRRANTDVLVVR
nr:carboxypeptidase regulatory-like domain-containing protein [Halarchaeum rubridurum]